MYRAVKYTKNRKSRIYLMGVFFAVMIAIAFAATDHEKISYDYGDGVLSVRYPGQDTMEIYFKDVLSLREGQNFTAGDAVDGLTAGDCRFGTFRNEELGIYHAALNVGIHTVVYLETAEGYYVLNYENDISTHSLFRAIQEAAGNFGKK